MTKRKTPMCWHRPQDPGQSEGDCSIFWLKRGGVALARVQKIKKGKHDGWWFSINDPSAPVQWSTAPRPFPTLEEAKADAMKRIRDAERREE